MSFVVCLFCRKMSKFIGKLKRVASSRSTRSSSSRASADMQIDDPSPRCGGQSRRGKSAGCVLQLLLADCTELMVPACYCDPSRWPATIAAAADG